MDKIKIENSSFFQSWEEVSNIEAANITKRDEDLEILDGLIIKGYEMKFDSINENREKYDPGCFDEFIQRYFIDHELNMVVSLQHSLDVDNLCGRVLYLEINTVGCYFVVYIPRTYVKYEMVKNLLKEGILQGLSKEGYTTDYEYFYSEDGSFDYIQINKMDICSVSLVAQPANGIKFEAMKETEIKNTLNCVNKIQEEQPLNDVEKLFKN